MPEATCPTCGQPHPSDPLTANFGYVAPRPITKPPGPFLDSQAKSTAASE